jgi:hypothetical protein
LEREQRERKKQEMRELEQYIWKNNKGGQHSRLGAAQQNSFSSLIDNALAVENNTGKRGKRFGRGRKEANVGP